MTEKLINKNNFITRLNQMIIQFDMRKRIRRITELERKMRSLIIIKKMLYFLTDSKVKISLKEVKLKIIEIEKCYNKDLLNEDILKDVLNTCVNIDKNLEYNLKSEIDKNIKLFKSWERINDAFNCKNIPKGELDNFQEELKLLMSIGGLLKSNEEISGMIAKYEKKINDFKKQKQNYCNKILEYMKNFSDKSFIERLIEGKPQPIKSLKPDMYKQLYESILKDKIKIILK